MMGRRSPTTPATRAPPPRTMRHLLHIPRSGGGHVEPAGSTFLCCGILSPDVEERRTRRNLQRTTCWRFPGVATRANDFTGAMLCCTSLGDTRRTATTTPAALLEEAAAVAGCGYACDE
ncbi:hypothetical protein TcBrA4_0038490 [Trypanosoma cruzi]|nr:hypothetical protein TcBrA4_0038490 [Trypanosoma cruzi]